MFQVIFQYMYAVGVRDKKFWCAIIETTDKGLLNKKRKFGFTSQFCLSICVALGKLQNYFIALFSSFSKWSKK